MNSFKALNLSAPILKALDAMQFQVPTPIQVQAIPHALAGKDIIGCAQTGTGKTAAFCVPILNRLLNSPEKTALILVPTRELAIQVNTFWHKLTLQLSQAQKLQSTVIIGGAANSGQARALARRPRVIVATPGRLADHLRANAVKLFDVGVLVLDEADRMLDMGFAPQLAQILRHLPRERQTLFFTATWEQKLEPLSKKYLRNPVRVSVGEISRAAPEVTQSLVMTTSQKKNQALLDELKRRAGSILVFARTKSRTDRVSRYLSEVGVPASRLHGGRSQGQRNAALTSFRNGQVRVMVATDVASRGIDVSSIAHVVNYDLPQCSEDYIHRIGRTGRAGAKGQAVSLVTPEDRAQWHEISRLLKRTGSHVPVEEPRA